MNTSSATPPSKLSSHSVTSLKYYSAYDGFRKHSRKPKPPLQLESFMSELIVENPIVYDVIQKQDLDHFERLKKLSQLHQLDITGFNTHLNNNYSSQQTAIATQTPKPVKSKRPCSSASKTPDRSMYKQINKKLKQQNMSFFKAIKSQDRVRNVKLRRSDILSDIQRRSAACLQKFIQNNEKKEIFSYVDSLLKQTQIKSKDQVGTLTLKCSKLEEQKDVLQRELLQTKLKVRSLERTTEEQLIRINQLVAENHHIQNNYRALSKFVKDFEAIQQFHPGVGCKDLIKHYAQLEEMCLNKLSSGDDTKLRAAESNNTKLKNELSSMKLSYDIVSTNLKGASEQLKELRQNQRQQDDNYQRLIRTQKQLKQVQNRIVEFYNNWYQNRENTIKGILKEVGCFKKDYSYLQMIDYMEMDLTHLSTPCKVDEYLRKVLATIQLAQRKVFPNNVSSSKIDPCKIVNDIVNYTLALKVRSKQGLRRADTADKQNDDIKYITEG